MKPASSDSDFYAPISVPVLSTIQASSIASGVITATKIQAGSVHTVSFRGLMVHGHELSPKDAIYLLEYLLTKEDFDKLIVAYRLTEKSLERYD